MMSEVIRPLSTCLAGLSFILGTVPPAAKVLDKHRERSRRVQKMKERLASCQAKFSSWEDHPRLSELQNRHGMSVKTFQDMEKLGETIYERIDGSDLPKAQTEAWKKTVLKLRRNMFAIPCRFAEDLCDVIWWDLWSEGDLDKWMTRLEKIVAAVHEVFEEEFDKQTDEQINTGVLQESSLRDLEAFASGLFDLGNELYRGFTTEPSISGYALGLKPPQPSCDISRWFVPIPIDVEMRFWIERECQNYEQFRMHVSHRQHNRIETTKEIVAQISEAKHPATAVQSLPYKFTRCHKHSEQAEERCSIGDLLNSGSPFTHEAAWLVDRAGLGYAISQWSLLFWNTPWLERLCCHGILLDLSVRSEECAHYVFESRIHEDCQPGAEDRKVRNLGLAWAQLALGLAIRPSLGSDLDFEIWSDDGWKNIQRDEINLEIIMATGSEQLQQAVDFCLRPESQMLNEPFNASFLLKCIKKMHEPIKSWYNVEVEYLKKRSITREY
ncbi:hypothetical protein DE146DRAFT_784971 [Phaeosphaeria sp. MPI-PUGE-AT-0046c]|nr:hypothetical protein DE146DRAFT_784971 [Phaeosphaeria sp. MPI-PUGE-AT-0046c]